MTTSQLESATHWTIDYTDIDPIRLRDPVAEALCVLEPGDPFVITYHDLVKAAGHSCPTASGAYRLAQVGLAALYPDSIPVRSEIAVTVAGPREDPQYGVISRLLSYITGAAAEDGFAGLAGGYGGRNGLLHFDEWDAEGVSARFERTDTGEAVEVTYHVGDVPSAGPAAGILPAILDGSASPEERETFAEIWHGRVRRVLTDDDLFTVTPVGQP